MRNHCKVAQREISVRIWAGRGEGYRKFGKIIAYARTGGRGGGVTRKRTGVAGQKVVNLDVILSGWSPVEIITTSHLYEFYLLVQFRF